MRRQLRIRRSWMLTPLTNESVRSTNTKLSGPWQSTFNSGSAGLLAEEKEELDQVGNCLHGTLKGGVVAVVGYADSRGTSVRNRSLSERRANAVINYLVT